MHSHASLIAVYLTDIWRNQVLIVYVMLCGLHACYRLPIGTGEEHGYALFANRKRSLCWSQLRPL